VLNVIDITKNFADIDKVKYLNEEAFPPDEREDVAEFVEDAEEDYSDFLAFYDGNTFVGFTVNLVDENIAYICYMAVEKELRSKGYRTSILDMLKEMYAGKQLIMDLECIDEVCSNSEQRLTRKQFYCP